jgi:hypothetical protein
MTQRIRHNVHLLKLEIKHQNKAENQIKLDLNSKIIQLKDNLTC